MMSRPQPSKSSRNRPRVLIGPEDLHRIRRRVGSGLGKRILDAVKARVEPMTDLVRETEDLKGLLVDGLSQWDHPGTYLFYRLPDMALVGAIERDEQVIDAVKKVLVALTQIRNGSKPGHGRYGAQAPLSIPMSYALMFDQLPDGEREKFVR